VTHGGFLSTDHLAITPLQSPHPTAGSDVHELDSLGAEVPSAVNIVLVIGVAAVDNDVIALHQCRQVLDDPIDERHGHHHPSGARLGKLCDEILE
jgi:hypothetical protein